MYTLLYEHYRVNIQLSIYNFDTNIIIMMIKMSLSEKIYGTGSQMHFYIRSFVNNNSHIIEDSILIIQTNTILF